MHKKTIFLMAAFFIIFLLSFAAQAISNKEPDRPGLISLDVKNMDIIDVLKILADEAGFNISVSGSLKARVTLFLKEIEVWDALEIALISANLTYEKKGRIIYVMDEKEYEAKYQKKYWDNRVIKIFNLKYARAQRASQILGQVVSGSGRIIIDSPTNTLVVVDVPERIDQMSDIVRHIDKPVKTKVFELNYLPVQELESKIREIITKDVGLLNIDSATNKIIVTDYPDKIKRVEQLLEAFDEKPLQVLIDAKIVEIRPSKKFYAGINWDYWIEKYFGVKGDFSIPSPTAVTDKVSFGTIGVTEASKKGDYSGIIDFLEIFGETKILSSPRILALNNQEAKILVGTKDVYITSSVSQIGDSAVTSQAVNFVDVGVKLYVTPNINRDGYVTLKIKPEISSSERKEIKSEDKVTEIPVVTTSEAETAVIVKEGVSIIIGGLRKVAHEKEIKKVPFLGSIPVLGVLFSSKSDELIKNELVILLTPRIVSGDKPIEAELKEKMQIGHNMTENQVISEFEEAKQ
ncbi:MAG: type II secretion system protein GspD [Candidatus Omnitrophica bacterium]|nr:type II secretion system protein GspD [Candidatus Omnitrophota bacterium]